MKKPPSDSVPKLRNILPDEPLLLMGAGPVPIAGSVSQANSVVINHLGDTMSKVTIGLQKLASYVYQTDSEKIIGVAGPASGAMEMAIANLLGSNRSVLVLDMGTFSHRWAEMAERVGAEVTVVKNKGIKPVSLEQVKKAYESADYDVLIATHGETSSGVILSELQEISKFAKSKGCLVVVDAVTSLGVLPFYMDDWSLDAVVAGGQKGLGSIPGVSLVAYSIDAWNYIESREKPPAQWCYDSKLAWKFWGDHGYHYTAPVPGVLALYAALDLIREETLESRWERHQISSNALQKAVEAMGLVLFAEEEYRLQSVVAIKVPEGVNGDEVRNFMAKSFSLEISGAFGHDIIRIGQMGEQCRAHNLFKTVYALGMAMQYYGVEVDISKAMAVLEENLAIDPETFLT